MYVGWHICAPLLGIGLGAFCLVRPICIVGGWVSSSGFPAGVAGLCVLMLGYCRPYQVSVVLVQLRFVPLAGCLLGGVGHCCEASSNLVCIATPWW